MDLQTFLAALHRLRNLRAPQLVSAGVMQRGDVDTYARFRGNPASFLASAETDQQAALWALLGPPPPPAARPVAPGIDKRIVP